MVNYPAHLTQIMYKKETTYGTEVTADSYFGRVTAFSFDRTNSIIRNYDVGDRNIQNLLLSIFRVTGSVNFDLIDFSVFEFLLGSRSGASPPYTYTTTTSLPSITIETARRGSTNMNFTITGCKCNSFTLSFNLNEPIRCTTSWIGRTVKEDSTIQTYTVPTTEPFTFIQSDLERNNVAIGIIQNGSLSVTHNLIEVRGIGNRLLDDLKVGQLDITYEFAVILDSGLATTILADAYGQGVGSGPINDGTGTATTYTLDFELDATGGRTATISLTNASVDSWTPPVNAGNNMCLMRVRGIAKGISISAST